MTEPERRRKFLRAYKRLVRRHRIMVRADPFCVGFLALQPGVVMADIDARLDQLGSRALIPFWRVDAKYDRP